MRVSDACRAERTERFVSRPTQDCARISTHPFGRNGHSEVDTALFSKGGHPMIVVRWLCVSLGVLGWLVVIPVAGRTRRG